MKISRVYWYYKCRLSSTNADVDKLSHQCRPLDPNTYWSGSTENAGPENEAPNDGHENARPENAPSFGPFSGPAFSGPSFSAPPLVGRGHSEILVVIPAKAREYGNMFSPALVCLSVCVSVCDHDN